jgi:transcriptional regulator with XRE-family HTH domain
MKIEHTEKPFAEAFADLFHNSKYRSLREFGRINGIDHTYLSRLKNGQAKNPSDEVMKTIAKGFGIDPWYFREYRRRKLAKIIREGGLDKKDIGKMSPQDIQIVQELLDYYQKQK